MPKLFINHPDPDPFTAGIDAEEPRAYKKSYKKSISGCKACKLRKIKCDEQRPVCTNCRKRYANVTCCEYNSKLSKSSKKLSASSRSSTSTPPAPARLMKQVSIKPFESDDSDRTLELRLLHHYTKTTCAGETLGEMVPIIRHSMWEINIPQIAFSSPVVLDALLGISALHLLSLQPEDQSLAFASRAYFYRAVIKQRNALSDLNAENAEPALVAAVLIAHHTWLAGHIFEALNGRYELNLQTYHMCLGIQALMRRACPWLEKYSFTQESEHDLDDGSRNKGFMKLALEDLASLSVLFHSEDVPAEDSDAYDKAARELVANYSLVTAKPLDIVRTEQAIITIMHRMTQRYIALLAAEDPLAIAIMARNLCLLSFLEDSKAWWIHGAGEQKVSKKAVLGIRGVMPIEWLWTMTWPMNIISKEIRLDPN